MSNNGNHQSSHEPRLLDLKAAAEYSGLSYWTLRDLAGRGYLRTVRIPDSHRPGRYLRRILFSRQSLDEFIAAHETTAIQPKLRVKKVENAK